MAGLKRIRAMLPAEIPALAEIWLRSVRATHTFLTEPDIGFEAVGRSPTGSGRRPFPLLHLREATNAD